MSCNLVYKNGKLEKVVADNGQPSILFKKAQKEFGTEIATDLYYISKSDEFKNDILTPLQTQADRIANRSKERLTQVIDRLKQTGLTNDVFLMSTQEIDAKLKELGVSEDVRKQVAEYVKGYYSNANVALMNLKDKNPKNVKGWISQLTDTQKNGGIKNVNQELEWIGLEDYLNNYVKENNPKAGNIPSSVVEDYIKSNQIEIVDVSKGLSGEFKVSWQEDDNGDLVTYDPATDTEYKIRKDFDEDGDEIFYPIINGRVRKEEYEYGIETVQNNIEIQIGYEEQETGDTKYSGYQLKGGENYREVLLTMPSKRTNITKAQKVLEEASLGNLSYDSQEVKDAQKTIDKYNTENKFQYKSSHWDESNILAHVRLNEKTLPDGRRVLIVNEVQSDWAQDGRKKGFTEKIVQPKNYDDLKVGDDIKGWGKIQTINEIEGVRYYNVGGVEITKEDFDFSKVKERTSEFSTPQMPYKNTDQWVGLVTRRVMQMASQEGYDGIAFATGQQSADMYSLSQQVDKINIGTVGAKKSVEIFLKNGTEDMLLINSDGIITDSVLSESYKGKKAEEVLGKDLTRKILETTEETTLEGEGLEFGGEGMKTFYDKIVPKVVQKEAQRFDKNAKLETVDFNVDQSIKAEPQYDNEGNIVRWKASKEGEEFIAVAQTEQKAIEKYKEMFPSLVNGKLSLGVQPYLPLTKNIKDSVSQAIPKFQKELGKNGISLETVGFVYKNQIYINSDIATEEVAVHEFGHLWNSWIKQNNPQLYETGIKLIKKEGKKYIEQVNKTQPNLVGERLYEEALAQAIGDNGKQLLDKNWINQVWDFIKDFFGLSQLTNEQIANLSLDEFARAASIDLLRGQDIRVQQAIQRNNGNPLNLAPNGKPSILYQSYKDLGYSDLEAERLTAQVYSDSFINNFFGDWINNPQNASKVVDENGQPMVVYHFTEESFYSFDKNLLGKKTKDGDIGIHASSLLGFWFNNNKDFYKSVESEYNVQKVFLNITDIKNINNLSDLWGALQRITEDTSETYNENGEDFEDDVEYKSSQEIADIYLEDYISYEDGIVVKNDTEFGGTSFIAFEPDQIKSATENVGTFSTDSNDIRYQIIGEQGAQNLEDAVTIIENLQIAKEMMLKGVDAKTIKLATGWEIGGEKVNFEELESKGIISKTNC